MDPEDPGNPEDPGDSDNEIARYFCDSVGRDSDIFDHLYVSVMNYREWCSKTGNWVWFGKHYILDLEAAQRIYQIVRKSLTNLWQWRQIEPTQRRGPYFYFKGISPDREEGEVYYRLREAIQWLMSKVECLMNRDSHLQQGTYQVREVRYVRIPSETTWSYSWWLDRAATGLTPESRREYAMAIVNIGPCGREFMLTLTEVEMGGKLRSEWRKTTELAPGEVVVLPCETVMFYEVGWPACERCCHGESIWVIMLIRSTPRAGGSPREPPPNRATLETITAATTVRDRW